MAPLQFNGGGRLLQELQDSYFKTRTNVKLLNLASATLVIKCPLFVQLNLHNNGLDIILTPSDNVEAYIPDVSMVSGETLEDRENIAKYIKVTTEALLLNQKGMPMDGSSDFTSQLLTPITVYNEIIVHGNLRNWLSFIKQKNLPKEIELYREHINILLGTEWKNIELLKKI